MSTIDYRSGKRILVSVKGHPYPRDAFFALFEELDGIAYTAVEQPASQVFFCPEHGAAYDAFVLYDMPGIDFATRPPELVEPSERLRRGFVELLERGHGCVFLHHAIAGWPTWPEYAEIVGGRFLYLAAPVRGVPRLDSGYRHAVSHEVRVLAEHPVTEGVAPAFTITDELYLHEVFADSVVPLLASGFGFDREHFFSATHAVTGRMFSNEGWEHPPGSNLVGWVKHYRNSPIVYLQMGDDTAAYGNADFRRLLENAIRWVMSEAAHEWARGRHRAETGS